MNYIGYCASQTKLISVVAILQVACSMHDMTHAAVNYKTDVSKVLRAHCVGCHNPNKTEAELDLSSYKAIMKGSYGGEIVVSGVPEDSLLYLVTAHLEEPAMPPGGKLIPAKDIEVLKKWIETGLPEDSSSITNPTEESNATTAQAPTEKEAGDSSPQLVFQGVHQNPVIALDASPTASLVAFGGQMQVLLVDADTWRLSKVLSYPEGEPQALRFSRDGTQLIAGGGIHSQSGGVVVWDIATGNRVAVYNNEYDVALAADLSPAKDLAVFAGPERLVKVLALASGEQLHLFKKHTNWIVDARFSPEGILLSTADRDGAIYVWETASGKTLHTLRGHSGAIGGIAWINGGNAIASASEDGSLRQWDMHTGKQTARWSAHTEGVVDLVATAKGQLATAGRDLRVRIWEPAGKKVAETNPLDSLPSTLASLNDGNLAIGTMGGMLYKWDVESGDLSVLELPKKTLTQDLAAIAPSESALKVVGGSPPAAIRSVSPQVVIAEPAIDASELSTSAQLLEQRLANVSTGAEQLLQQATTLKNQIASVEAEIAKLTKQSASPEKSALLESAIQSKSNQLATLGTTLEQLQSAKQETAKGLANLHSLAGEADGALQQAIVLQNLVVEKLTAAIDESVSQKQVADDEIKLLRGQLAELAGSSNPAAEQELNKLQQSLSSYQEQLAELESRMSALLRTLAD